MAVAKPVAAPTSPERDLPEPLDQKMATWEAVQKENYLSKLERQRKDSKGEVLRKTAHRCRGPREPPPGGKRLCPCSASQGRPDPRVGRWRLEDTPPAGRLWLSLRGVGPMSWAD